MNASLREKCADPAEPWRYRCRVLELDDVAGVIRRYGGRARPLGAEFCDRSGAEPARQLAAGFDPATRDLVLTWTHSPLYRRVYLMHGQVCPTQAPTYATRVRHSRHGADLVRRRLGRYCMSAWADDSYGRVSAPASVWVDVAGLGVHRVVGLAVDGLVGVVLGDLLVVLVLHVVLQAARQLVVVGRRRSSRRRCRTPLRALPEPP